MRQEYPKELIQPEIKPENRTGTIEQLAQNVEAVEKQVQLKGEKMSQNHMYFNEIFFSTHLRVILQSV